MKKLVYILNVIVTFSLFFGLLYITLDFINLIIDIGLNPFCLFIVFMASMSLLYIYERSIIPEICYKIKEKVLNIQKDNM
jgi:hypothetical protein